MNACRAVPRDCKAPVLYQFEILQIWDVISNSANSNTIKFPNFKVQGFKIQHSVLIVF